MGAVRPIPPNHVATTKRRFRELYDLPDGRCVVWIRTKVVGPAHLRIRPQALGELHVGRERLQHMLPWSDRKRTANRQLLACAPRAQCVGDQTIFRPISASDYISSPGRG